MRENAIRQKVLQEKRKKALEAWATRKEQATQANLGQIAQESAAREPQEPEPQEREQ